MSVTGVVLTYERQLIAWSDRQFHSRPSSPDTARLPLSVVIERLRRDHPELSPASLTVSSDPDDPIAISTPPKTLYVDAYSGVLLGEGSQGMRQFMSSMRAWHRWLGVSGEGRAAARVVTGWSNLLFLFIVVSGVYLWFPRKWTWQRVRPVVWFTRTSSGKARDFNWHNSIGAWSFVPLFIVVLTAVPMSFPWANALVYRIVGDEPPAAAGPGGREANREGRGSRERSEPSFAGIDDALARVRSQVSGWRTIAVRTPTSERAPLVLAIDRGDGGQPQLRSTMTIERGTGRVVSHETFESQSPGRRLRSFVRFGHTGEVLGIAGQTIAGVATAGAVVLVWTGLALAWRRWRGWMKRRADRAESIAVQSSAA